MPKVKKQRSSPSEKILKRPLQKKQIQINSDDDISDIISDDEFVEEDENHNSENKHRACDHTFEDEIFEKNPDCKYIMGIDETARGNWAGNVKAVAYLYLKGSKYIKNIGDSKKKSRKQIKEFFDILSSRNHYYSCVSKSPQIIDQINILQATFLAMKEASEQTILKFETKERKIGSNELIILIDGNMIPQDQNEQIYNIFQKYQTRAITKGDSKSYTIASASLLCKQLQIEEMQDFHRQYPQEYEFHKNSGYRNKGHLKSLWDIGVLPIHRLSFDIKEFGGTLGRLKYLQEALGKNKNIIKIINTYDPSKKCLK
jgi:ribonuclease HII